MKIITGKRGCGKTTNLIHMSAETGAHIVCHSQKNAKSIYYVATQELGLKIPVPITYYEFIHGRNTYRTSQNVLIDNVEMFVQYIAGDNIVLALTATLEDESDMSSKEEEKCQQCYSLPPLLPPIVTV